MLIRPLPNELQKKAETELNEVPSRIQEDLAHIREWIQKQPHLNARTDDQWLLSFLRGCKFSLQRTKEKLDYYYTARTLIPELFSNRDPFLPEIQEVLKAGCFCSVTKTKAPEVALPPRTIVCHLTPYDYKVATLEDIVKVYFMVADILILEDDDSIISGISMWSNLKNMPINIISQFTPSLLKKILMSVQHGYPLRIKNICNVNSPAIFETTFSIIKSFMSDKIRKRFNVYSENNYHKMLEEQPKECIPDESSFQEAVALWKTKIESYREWFLDEEKYRTDEAKRLGVSKTSADLFGVEGSFRKLNID